MDNSGTKKEAAARYRPDTHEQKRSRCRASRCVPGTLNATAHANALLAKFRDAGNICRRQRAHDHIDIRKSREHIESYDLAEPPFHPVAIDCGMRIPRHYDTCPGMMQKGSDVPNLEMRGSDSLPLQADRLERAFSRQSESTRKAAVVRCPRISTAV
jgi:hypothetical protein